MTDYTGEPTTDDPTPGRASDGVLWQQAADHFLRYRAGESRGLDDLVRLLTPVLWHVVRAYGLDRHHAEDVIQTTWLTLVRRHESIRQPQAVSSWIIITARREAWRASRDATAATPMQDEVLATRVPDVESAESRAVANDAHVRLWRAVDSLGDRCRRLLRVIAFDDRPDYAGLAEELAMPIGSIGPTRGRCLNKLRDALREQGESR
ncbi:RNA polymerase sigma factor [Flexivirga caeni]|uniref:Sigma-70 family RNA polymerase sigma factor n=1 Tax=Flexivirga caeni TaxID=2294115 RepID=A0A3M9MIA9_9MICO|nr:sigma-70 family RNA polymerase sigma factor [Flexivirga caeni]RNI25309.1 sigma-70 family RNA polymerase sigma factor [Flexivirga caeni]